jgi:hypothetical protein
VGAGALGAGIAFGFRAAALWSDRNRACPMESCTAEGLNLGERAHFSAGVSTWTVAAGGVALVGAALMLLLPAGRTPRTGSGFGAGAGTGSAAAQLNVPESPASLPASGSAMDPLSPLRHLKIHARGLAIGGTF